MAAQIIIFDNADFSGTALLVNDEVANLGRFGLNDRVSSVIVLSGMWQFYEAPDFESPYLNQLGPGQYHWIREVGISNDTISSLKAV